MPMLRFSALALAAAPLPAAACSPVAGYRPPTNLELTAAADLILLAAIEDGATPPGNEDRMTLRVRPLAAIKGTMPTGPIALPQAMIATGAMAGLRNPYELADPHPQSPQGASRSAERRDGTEDVSTCRSRCAPYHSK